MTRIVILVSLALSLGLSASGQGIPAPMHPPRLVNDFAQVLSPGQAAHLEHMLRAYHDTTSTQIYVVSVTDLMGYSIADFAFQLGQAWGVGQRGKDNGVVILIKPRVGHQRGEVMIATGYGMEEVVPDALAKRIVEQEMIPYFRQERYFEGIHSAVVTIQGLASGRFTPDQYGQQQPPPAGGFLALALMALFFVILRNVGRARGRSIGRSSIPFWIAMGMAAGAGRRRGGGFGHFSSGGGSFGGFGGFGGGGGGSFGGGGARGSW